MGQVYYKPSTRPLRLRNATNCDAGIISQTFKNKPKRTNLQELWSRPVDYTDFPSIFENKNEYANSVRYIQDVNTSELSRSLQVLDEIKRSDVKENPQDVLCRKQIKRLIQKNTLASSDRISPDGADILLKYDKQIEFDTSKKMTPSLQEYVSNGTLDNADFVLTSGASSLLTCYSTSNQQKM